MAGHPTTVDELQAAVASMFGSSRDGVWIAYYADRSEAVPFGTEVDALRYAVEHSCKVHFVKWGNDVVTGEGREP